MNVPLWLIELAAAFWQLCGGPEPFPRNLRRPLVRGALDLTIKELPRLSVHCVERYLAGLDIPWKCSQSDRPLRACLAAYGGAGLVFLDPADAPPERTASLAHEVAHFLRHYWQPRQQACRRLGDQVREVFDGKRPPTVAERVQALLTDVPMGLHVHFMGRGPRREVISPVVARAEQEADQLAYQLLAPVEAVVARVGQVEGETGRARLEKVLCEEFGLAAGHAKQYG